MSQTHWQTTKQANIACAVCGKIGSCTVSPDRKAFKCWREGGMIHQTEPIGQYGSASRTQRRRASAKATSAKTSIIKPAPKVFSSTDDAIAAAGRSITGGTLTHVWTYRNPAGIEVMRIARFDLADGTKQFRPVHPVQDGWCIGDPDGALPLYRLNEIPATGTIYICEGEKATDAARSIGLSAGTSAHGSSAPDKTDWTQLAGRDVVILPDHDEPGRKYARAVSAIRVKLEPPARVKIVALPGLPDGGDMVEYIDASAGQSFDVIRGGIETLAIADRWIDRSSIIGGPVLINLSDVVAEEVNWLWLGKIALGKLAMLVGEPGCGKSFITIDAASRVTTGTPWPDGSPCPRGSVVMACAEDDPADTNRPRFDAAGGDASKVTLIDCVRFRDDKGNISERGLTLADIGAIKAAVEARSDCKLLIIDPVGSYTGSGIDAHRDNDVRWMLAPLVKLARDRGIAVLIVAHTRKSSGGTADERALGSRAFVGVVRAVHHVVRDAENSKRRMMLPGKNNLAEEGHGLAFTVGGKPPVVRWEDTPVTMTADDAYGALDAGKDGDRGRPPAERSEAANWLMGQLQAGPVVVNELKARAEQHKLAWRTVGRAKAASNIISERCPYTKRQQWRLATSGTSPNTPISGILAQSDIPLEKPGDSACPVDARATMPEFNLLGIDAGERSAFGIPDAPYAGGGKS